jgi:8-oxo-dGTP pyrophosphatase MutT (NUDIX family)
LEVKGKLHAPFHAAMEDVWAEIRAIKRQPTLQDALYRSRVDTLVDAVAKLEESVAIALSGHDRLTKLEWEFAARRVAAAHRNRLLWRLLPWILTAAVGIGLGIANHYEGWIKLEIGNEAADR